MIIYFFFPFFFFIFEEGSGSIETERYISLTETSKLQNRYSEFVQFLVSESVTSQGLIFVCGWLLFMKKLYFVTF